MIVPGVYKIAGVVSFWLVYIFSGWYISTVGYIYGAEPCTTVLKRSACDNTTGGREKGHRLDFRLSTRTVSDTKAGKNGME